MIGLYMLLLALLLVIIQVAVAKVKDRIAAATYRITLVHAGYSTQHTDFNEDTTDEGASVACSNIRLWKLDSQKEWRNTSGRLW